MEQKNRQLAVIHDGTRPITQVIDTESGEPIEGVVSVDLHVSGVNDEMDFAVIKIKIQKQKEALRLEMLQSQEATNGQ